jgi:hypothetical protein
MVIVGQLGTLGVTVGPCVPYAVYGEMVETRDLIDPEMALPPLLPATITLGGGTAILGAGFCCFSIGVLMIGFEMLTSFVGEGSPTEELPRGLVIGGLIAMGAGIVSTHFSAFYSWLSAESAYKRLSAALAD